MFTPGEAAYIGWHLGRGGVPTVDWAQLDSAQRQAWIGAAYSAIGTQDPWWQNITPGGARRLADQLRRAADHAEQQQNPKIAWPDEDEPR